MSETNPCQACDGKCCRYYALQIDEPKTPRDFDDIRWYLCHKDTRVFVEDGEWYLEVLNECRHLDENNRCRIYDRRPALCREHSTGNCEGRDDLELDREHEFRTDDELARFAEGLFAERKRRKNKKRAKKNKGKKRNKK